MSQFISHSKDVGETVVVLVIPIFLAFLAVQRWGKRSFVNWLREALTHENGDGGDAQLVSVNSAKESEEMIRRSIDGIQAFMSTQHSDLAAEIKSFSVEVKALDRSFAEHVIIENAAIERIERSVERMTDRIMNNGNK